MKRAGVEAGRTDTRGKQNGVVCSLPLPSPPSEQTTRDQRIYLRRLVLHDPAHVGNVEAPRRHVRAEEDPPLRLGEALEHAVALLLDHPPVQRREEGLLLSGGGCVAAAVCPCCSGWAVVRETRKTDRSWKSARDSPAAAAAASASAIRRRGGAAEAEDGAEGWVALEERSEVVDGRAGDEEDHHLFALVPLRAGSGGVGGWGGEERVQSQRHASPSTQTPTTTTTTTTPARPGRPPTFKNSSSRASFSSCRRTTA